MTTRRQARRTAIDILFQADLTGEPPTAAAEAWRAADEAVPEFAEDLVRGVDLHRAEIDSLLDRHAQDWTVARMSILDRTIMRVCVFELLYRPDVPASASISEAVEAAAQLSSEASRSFVNGILGRIARELGKDPSSARA